MPPSDTMSSLRASFEAEPANVIEEISPNDTMHARNRRWYDKAGQMALESIRLAMLTADKPRVESILDFGCGHGRVLRTLKAAFPEAALTACDTDRDGVDFCARVFDAKPVYSSRDPAEISIEDRFDLVWCGSFFTHVDLDGWNSFLPFLASLPAKDGILVFTTAGRGAVRRLREEPSRWMLRWMLEEEIRSGFLADYDRDGFAHRNSGRYPGWGYTAAAPSWVCRRLEQLGNLRLLGVTESKNVDTFSCSRVEA
jgi:SAM-dependent methyltransferase